MEDQKICGMDYMHALLLFPDNKKGSIPSERTLKDRGSSWPNASRRPWPRLRLQAWSKTNAKARQTEQRVKRMKMAFSYRVSLQVHSFNSTKVASVSCCRLSQAEYHEQEEIFKLRLGHLKKVMVAIRDVSLLQMTFPQ